MEHRKDTEEKAIFHPHLFDQISRQSQLHPLTTENEMIGYATPLIMESDESEDPVYLRILDVNEPSYHQSQSLLQTAMLNQISYPHCN